jgi:hypothetical protein
MVLLVVDTRYRKLTLSRMCSDTNLSALNVDNQRLIFNLQEKQASLCILIAVTFNGWVFAKTMY